MKNMSFDWSNDRGKGYTRNDLLFEWVPAPETVIIGNQGAFPVFQNLQETIISVKSIEMEVLLHRDDPYDTTALIFSLQKANQNTDNPEGWDILPQNIPYDFYYETPVGDTSDFVSLWPRLDSDYNYMQSILTSDGTPKRYCVTVNDKLKPGQTILFSVRYLNTAQRTNAQNEPPDANGRVNEFMVDNTGLHPYYPPLKGSYQQLRITAIYRVTWKNG